MRPHRWLIDGRCAACAMRREWPGARDACPLPLPVEANAMKHKSRASRRASVQLTTAQKREVTWRSRRGATVSEIARRIGVPRSAVRAQLEEARISAALGRSA